MPLFHEVERDFDPIPKVVAPGAALISFGLAYDTDESLVAVMVVMLVPSTVYEPTAPLSYDFQFGIQEQRAASTVIHSPTDFSFASVKKYIRPGRMLPIYLREP